MKTLKIEPLGHELLGHVQSVLHGMALAAGNMVCADTIGPATPSAYVIVTFHRDDLFGAARGYFSRFGLAIKVTDITLPRP